MKLSGRFSVRSSFAIHHFLCTEIMKKMPPHLLIFLALAGCGGGADTGAGAGADSGGDVVIQGRVTSATGEPVPGAKVSLPYAENESYDAVTRPDGSFTLNANLREVEGVDPVAVTVQADTFQPEAIYLNAGTQVRRPQIDVPPTALQQLGPAEFVLPAGARPLIHLGDDAYRGSANSRLQVATSGTSTSQPLGVWTPALGAQYQSAVIELSARGLQTDGSSLCASQYDNQIGLVATDPSSGAEIVRTVRPGASSAQGSFTRLRIPVDVSDFPEGAQINFFASSGRCLSGGSDYDDYEFTAVVVRFTS